MKFYSRLALVISELDSNSLPTERKEILQELIDYIQSNLDKGAEINLNFICTHNSRRSQFSQVWAQVAADYYGVTAHCFSGGVEVTACNERTVSSLSRFGFEISAEGDENPLYSIVYSNERKTITAFSKLYDDPTNPAKGFSAIMTCSHADENCPFIPGAEKRIPVRYEDPKAFDDTPSEAEQYDVRSKQIANEMFYVFSQLKK